MCLVELAHVENSGGLFLRGMLYNTKGLFNARSKEFGGAMQQHSSMVLFCEECGAANETTASSCVACQVPLVAAVEELPALPMLPAPVHLAPPVVREVMAGAPPASVNQDTPLDLLPGTLLLGRYRVRREIGRGGFSIVYLANDDQHFPVAIKRIPLSTLTPRQMIDATETFNREIQMLMRLKYMPGIPKFYASYTDAGNWYLIMEYIEGQTLEEYLQQRPGGYLSESESALIGQKLADILINLHQSGLQIVFRDVKPSNIMITPGKKLYLIDFGIARVFKMGQRKDTTPLGSPGYAPPEQYGRMQTDARADIYSLGATLQTLLTGRDPLELAQGEPSRNSRQWSGRMQRLLAAMLNPDPACRPATMQNVRQQLSWNAAFGPGNRLRASVSTGLGLVMGLLMATSAGGNASFRLGFWIFGCLSGLLWLALGSAILGVNWWLRKRASKRGVDGFFFTTGLVAALLLGSIVAVYILSAFLWSV